MQIPENGYLENLGRPLIAEARKNAETAEAIAQHGEVVIVEKLIEMLPQYAREVASPLKNIESVKIVDTGSGEGVASYGKSIGATMLNIQEPLKELTGIDVSKLLTDLVNRGNTHTTVVIPEKDSKVVEPVASYVEDNRATDKNIVHVKEK